MTIFPVYSEPFTRTNLTNQLPYLLWNLTVVANFWLSLVPLYKGILVYIKGFFAIELHFPLEDFVNTLRATLKFHLLSSVTLPMNGSVALGTLSDTGLAVIRKPVFAVACRPESKRTKLFLFLTPWANFIHNPIIP